MTHTFQRKNSINCCIGTTKETVIYEGQKRGKQLQTEGTRTFLNQVCHQRNDNVKPQLNFVSSVIFSLFITKISSIPFSAFLSGDLLHVCACHTHTSQVKNRISSENLYAHNRSDCLLSPGLLKMLFYIFPLLPLVPKVLRANSLLSTPLLCARAWFRADQLIAESEQQQ